MRILLFASILFLLAEGSNGAQKITLTECIDASLKNKDNIISLRTDALVAERQTSAGYSGYLPQVSVNYDYRYYAIRPTQIIPVGLFSPVPTDEKRAMQFGTPWQQNAGINLYQPLIDLSISSRISESKIVEKIKNSDVEVAESDLKTEVIKSYTNIWILQEQLHSALLDTIRTSRTLKLLLERSDEGQAEQTDINNALLNRNNSLIAYKNANAEILKEKIYLGFLTGLKLEYFLHGEFDFSIPFTDIAVDIPLADSLPEVINLKLQSDLLGRQLISEKRKFMPVLGVEGFLGANQYTYEFDPLDNQSWYGTSYIGLSLKLPLITGENKSSMVRQIKLQEESINSTISDRIKSIVSSNMQLAEEVRQLEYQLDILQQNISLLTENADIYQNKFAEGQVNAADLLNQEIDLRRETARMNETRAQLTYKKIELIINSGKLNDFIR